MDKNPERRETPLVEKIKKTSKNRKETSPMDKRRWYTNCGICGSEDVTYKGYIVCDNCGKVEEDEFSRRKYLFSHVHRVCDCDRKYTYSVGCYVCPDCGATKSYPCPNCSRKTWGPSPKDIYNIKIYCRWCGYIEYK